MPKTNACPGHQIHHGSRREFLWKPGGGLGGVALASMLNDSAYLHLAKVS